MKFWMVVKPNARHDRIEQLPDGSYRVSVHAPAHEGLANDAVIKLLAKHFKITQSQIKILVGHKGRKKLVEITV